MTELIVASFSSTNLFFTTLFILVAIYWTSVILGAIGMDAVDFDFDVDVDVDVDIDVDADIDADVDVAEVGLMIGVLRFFNFGKVPFMVLISFSTMIAWALSVYANHQGSWINTNNSFIFAAILFIPIILLSLLSTKIITTPLIPLFAQLDTAAKDLEIEGKVGTLMTSIEDKKLGQIKIDIDGAIVSLSVKSNDGISLRKGEKVVIVEEEKKGKKIFIVEKINHH